MGYILIFVALVGFFTYLNQKSRTNSIKRNGVRTTGVIIQNTEMGEYDGRSDNYRLGGNINDPVVRFTTDDGRIITGRPVVGFTSQYEVTVPHTVNIVYNAKDPKQFYIDFG